MPSSENTKLRTLINVVFDRRPVPIEVVAEETGILPARLRERVSKEYWWILRENAGLLTTTSDDLERLYAEAIERNLDLDGPIDGA